MPICRFLHFLYIYTMCIYIFIMQTSSLMPTRCSIFTSLGRYISLYRHLHDSTVFYVLLATLQFEWLTHLECKKSSFFPLVKLFVIIKKILPISHILQYFLAYLFLLLLFNPQILYFYHYLNHAMYNL